MIPPVIGDGEEDKESFHSAIWKTKKSSARDQSVEGSVCLFSPTKISQGTLQPFEEVESELQKQGNQYY